MPVDPACPSPQLEPITLCALVLGRIQIGIARASDGVLELVAARSVRESLVAALRQEGHAFTEERFFAWYAGLETLSDGTSSHLRSPRALGHAVLTELRHNPWTVLAQCAEHLQRAFMAPSDFHGGTDHEELHRIIEEARALVSALDRFDEGHPFHAVARLFHGAMRSPRFAREERSLNLVRGIVAEQDKAANCRWALDILAGRYLAPEYGLPLAIPLPGLVNLPLAPLEADDLLPTDAAMPYAIAGLHDAFHRLDHMLEQAERDIAIIDARLLDRRSSGRARELAIYLAGFGSLSGRQIEQVIGVSRPGVRVVTAALETEGLAIARRSRNAARVHSFAPHELAACSGRDERTQSALTSSAIAEYEASMQAIDELLRRSSVNDLPD